MNSIGIRLDNIKSLDCGKLCKDIQHLISTNISTSNDKILLIKIHDIVENKEPTKLLELKS